MCQKNFPTTIALNSISQLFYKLFLLKIKKNLISLYSKIQNNYFIYLMIMLKRMKILDTNYFTPGKC